MGKKVAHVIKAVFAPKPISTIEPLAYADQFLQDAEKRFTPKKGMAPKIVAAPPVAAAVSIPPAQPDHKNDPEPKHEPRGVSAASAGHEGAEGSEVCEAADEIKEEGVEISLVPGSHAGEGGRAAKGATSAAGEGREEEKAQDNEVDEDSVSADVSEGSHYSPHKSGLAKAAAAAAQDEADLKYDV